MGKNLSPFLSSSPRNYINTYCDRDISSVGKCQTDILSIGYIAWQHTVLTANHITETKLFPANHILRPFLWLSKPHGWNKTLSFSAPMCSFTLQISVFWGLLTCRSWCVRTGVWTVVSGRTGWPAAWPPSAGTDRSSSPPASASLAAHLEREAGEEVEGEVGGKTERAK